MAYKEVIKHMRNSIEKARNNNTVLPVFKSRFTPGLENGKDVGFQIGDVVSYRTRNGNEYRITIDSKRMLHEETGFLGYEAIFDDGRYFAVEDGIYDWEGKQ